MSHLWISLFCGGRAALLCVLSCCESWYLYPCHRQSEHCALIFSCSLSTWLFRESEYPHLKSHCPHLNFWRPLCWTSSWEVRLALEEKFLLHWSHLKLALACLCNLLLWMNRLDVYCVLNWQVSHCNSLFSAWVYSCAFKSWGTLKHFSHFEHMWGFSPVCFLLWKFKAPNWVNLLAQNGHTWGFSPVWLIMCVRRICAVANLLSQREHLANFVALCVLSCFTRSLLSLKFFSQKSHFFSGSVWITSCLFSAL